MPRAPDTAVGGDRRLWTG